MRELELTYSHSVLETLEINSILLLKVLLEYINYKCSKGLFGSKRSGMRKGLSCHGPVDCCFS